MSSTSVLITGGAGFIGSALASRLVEAGYDVAVMDILHPQVHGEHATLDLPPSVRFFTGGVTACVAASIGLPVCALKLTCATPTSSVADTVTSTCWPLMGVRLAGGTVISAVGGTSSVIGT